jgi:hypothetical protein
LRNGVLVISHADSKAAVYVDVTRRRHDGDGGG